MKRARRADIKYEEVVSTISSYSCPHCNVGHKGASINKYITRFSCISCGNEIIVNERKTIKYRA